MGNAWTWIKSHPWTVAGIVGAIIVLYLLMRMGGSSGGTQVVAAGASPEQVQANTALQIAQLQTAAQVQGMAYQLSAKQAEIAGAITIEQYHANVDMYQTQTQGTVSLAQTEAQRQVGLAGITAQQIIALGAQQTEQRQIAAIEAINLASQDTIQQLAYYNAQTQQAGIAGQVAIADINATTNRYGYGLQATTQQQGQRQNFLGGLFQSAASVLPFLI